MHPFAAGITVTVPEIEDVVVFVALNDGMFTLPDGPSPIAVLELTHVNVVPLTVPVKLMAVVKEPLHKVWFVSVFIVGVGLTVIVKTVGVPLHPLDDGVTVTVAITGLVPVLTALKERIYPVPLAARPMLVFVLLHV